MSLYALQKSIRDFNRSAACRKAFFDSPAQFLQGYDLTDEERNDLISLNLGKLYAQGVHGLLLRPFSIIHSVSEADYLKAIRGEK